MTNEKMKEILAHGGLTVADIEKVQEKFDADKITEIIEAASNPKEAFESIHAFYPELEIEKLEAQMDFIQGQIETAKKSEKTAEVVELTEKELENVSGGGFFEWIDGLSTGWKAVAIIATAAVGAAVVLSGAGAIFGGVMSVVEGTSTFLAGAALGASVGAGAGAGLGIIASIIPAIAVTTR